MTLTIYTTRSIWLWPYISHIQYDCDHIYHTFNMTVIIYTNYSTWLWPYISHILVPIDAICCVSWGEGIQNPLSKCCLLLFILVTFLIYMTLSSAGSGVYWCWSCFLCSGLTYEIYRSGPSMYVYCMVCYRVIVAPLVDDSECPWAMSWLDF